MSHWKLVLRYTGYAFFAAASLVFGYVLFISCHRWTVMKRPVKVEDGYSFSQTFTVDRTEFYVLGIECRTTIPFEKLKVIMMHDLAATFSIHEGQTLVDDNSFPRQGGTGWGKDEIFKGLGRFEAKPWHTYRVDVKFTHSLPALASTYPLAIVEVDPVVQSDAAVATIILTIFALILTLPGTILVQPYYNAIRKQRRLTLESEKSLR